MKNQRENKKPASIGSRTPDQRGRRFIGSQYIYFYNLYRMYLIYKGYLLLISHFLFSWVSEANLPYGLAMFIKWSSWHYAVHYAVQWYYLPLPICPSPITPPHLPLPFYDINYWKPKTEIIYQGVKKRVFHKLFYIN